jgi:hypothetical protein
LSQDEVNVQFRGHVLLDRVDEVAELAKAIPLRGLADDLAAPGVERGQEACRAVAGVVVGPLLDLS